MSTYSHITAGQVAWKVNEIATASPDFIYEAPDGTQCVYVETDTNGNRVGSCVVGRALIALGVAPGDIIEQASSFLALNKLGILTAFEDSHETRYWINRVQADQDEGKPWGVAIASANVEYPSVAAQLASKAVSG